MSALAAFRTAILALLDDAGQTKFTNAQVDQALRWALTEYSRARPLEQTYYLDAAGTRVNSMPSDFTAFKITNVQIAVDGQDDIDIPFHAYMIDQDWAFKTVDRVVAVDYVFKITYAGAHTIADLDSADQTTFPVADETTLHIGAAGHAAEQRLGSRSEAINLSDKAIEDIQAFANRMLKAFTVLITPPIGSSFVQLPTIPTSL